MRQGRTVVLIGHVGHPEVEGTLGQIPGKVLLVQNEKDVAALDLPDDTPIAYVTQTTLSVDDTRGIIAALTRRFKDVMGPGHPGYLLRDTKSPDGAARTRQACGRYLRGGSQE